MVRFLSCFLGFLLITSFFGCSDDIVSDVNPWDIKEFESFDPGEKDTGVIEPEVLPQVVRGDIEFVHVAENYRLLGESNKRILKFFPNNENYSCKVEGINFIPDKPYIDLFHKNVKHIEFGDISSRYDLRRQEYGIEIQFRVPMEISNDIPYTIKTSVYGLDEAGVELSSSLGFKVEPILSRNCVMSSSLEDSFYGYLVNIYIGYNPIKGYDYPLKDGNNKLATFSIQSHESRNTGIDSGLSLGVRVLNLCFEITSSENTIVRKVGFDIEGYNIPLQIFESTNTGQVCFNTSDHNITIENGDYIDIKMIGDIELSGEDTKNMFIKLTKVDFTSTDENTYKYRETFDVGITDHSLL